MLPQKKHADRLAAPAGKQRFSDEYKGYFPTVPIPELDNYYKAYAALREATKANGVQKAHLEEIAPGLIMDFAAAAHKLMQPSGFMAAGFSEIHVRMLTGFCEVYYHKSHTRTKTG
jgi:hypothetical protein